MPASGAQNEFAVGFLAVSHNPEKGFVGGLLVLNGRGRPLEFRCTAPVQPNRAQEVLYGPTLGPYLRGELIADALFKSTKLKPQIVFTNSHDNMSARNALTVPLVLIQDDESAASEKEVTDVASGGGGELSVCPQKQRRWRLDAGCSSESLIVRPNWLEFQLAGRNVAVSGDFPGDQEDSARLWQEAESWIDLSEPFDRVHEAIDESLAG